MIDRRDHTPINAGWKQSVKFTLQSLYAVMHDHLVVVPQKEHLGMLIYRSSGSIPSTPTEWNQSTGALISPSLSTTVRIPADLRTGTISL